MMYLSIGILLILCILCFVLCRLFRKNAAEKVSDMSQRQKDDLLENLVFPFGYTYLHDQDIFSSSLYAWQKRFGYSAFYDKSAPHFHMVFDALPVYFNYGGCTWLIEFWKGQYGIHSGCEIGIYKSDEILEKEDYCAKLFHAVEKEEMLPLSFRLTHNNILLASLEQTHWWLTAFCCGYFSNPAELKMENSITFPNTCMAHAFTNALESLGYDVCICGLKVCFTFDNCPNRPASCIQQLYRRQIQWQNRQLCRLFLWFTAPFTTTQDRVLFLFESIPALFHRILQIHKSPKNVRKLT